jgi:hypothetical protein
MMAASRVIPPLDVGYIIVEVMVGKSLSIGERHVARAKALPDLPVPMMEMLSNVNFLLGGYVERCALLLCLRVKTVGTMIGQGEGSAMVSCGVILGSLRSLPTGLRSLILR